MEQYAPFERLEDSSANDHRVYYYVHELYIIVELVPGSYSGAGLALGRGIRTMTGSITECMQHMSGAATVIVQRCVCEQWPSLVLQQRSFPHELLSMSVLRFHNDAAAARLLLTAA